VTAMNPVLCGIVTTLATAFLLTLLVRWLGPPLQSLSQPRIAALAVAIWLAAIGAGIWVGYRRWRTP